MRILITGKDSYIGTSFENWVMNYNPEWEVDTICVKEADWEKTDFSNYHTVFHVAGIAHVSTDPSMEELYYKVNRDLAIKVAQKAKHEGVKQFIFMSSIIIYGDTERVCKKGIINKDTIPQPSNFYGQSKLQAEQGLRKLQDGIFKVAIIRPPMIYGRNSKGNYPRLAKIAMKIPIFPDIDNQRSMLYIDNLCEFIRLIIKNLEEGIFYPQNKEYTKTSEMVKLVAEVHGKKLLLTKLFNPCINILRKRMKLLNKVFGNMVYEASLSEYKEEYRVKDLKQSIIESEGRG